MNTEQKDLERIKQKISFLLQKTTDNGATEQEMLSAIKLAEKLMRKYSIIKSDVIEPIEKDSCILKVHTKYKTGYKTEFFISSLAELFDCQHYWTKKTIVFFGYKEDVELCIYFYDLILKICFQELDKYFKSEEGYQLKEYYHGRTLYASFIRGFLNRIDEKLYEMYINKKNTINKREAGLIISKRENVNSEFDNLGIKIRKANFKEVIGCSKAYANGYAIANETSITQPLNTNSPQTNCLE